MKYLYDGSEDSCLNLTTENMLYCAYVASYTLKYVGESYCILGLYKILKQKEIFSVFYSGFNSHVHIPLTY